MLAGEALKVYMQRMLAVLDNNRGREVREQQAVLDFQIGVDPNARPDDVRQALDALAGQNLASKRHEPLRGWLWAITPDGKAEAEKLSYETM